MIRPMIKYLKNHTEGSLIGVEVGVWQGENALSILENLDIEKLFLVDPWKRHRIYTGRLFKQKKMNGIFEECKDRLVDYKEKVVFIRKNSVGGSLMTPCDLDFAYINGQHMYIFVKKGIQRWYPKVKPGGVFGGHDYNPNVTDGVVKAVDEFVEANNLELHTKELDWWVVKK